jgi:glucuronate isomerase
VPFIHEDFLLETRAARRLYHEFAATEPILDYHCHLPPADVARNRRFANLFEIALEGDHYKWRAMRANGIPESHCTGNASPYEKFLAFARTVPNTLRNPLYHWTHLELKRYFGIDTLLDENTAPKIWARTEELLKKDDLSAHGILKKFRVKAVCTTDDPTDELEHHQAISGSKLATKVLPTFRPDKALRVDQPALWRAWTKRLSEVSGIKITTFAHFLKALRARHDYFHAMGGRLSDHGLNHLFVEEPSLAKAAKIFTAAKAGRAAKPTDAAIFGATLMHFFGQLDAEKGWTKQVHLGARRANSSRAFGALGPDTGFDSIGDWNQLDGLGNFLDRLDKEGSLPKMVLYNLNPSDNYGFATMAGNFNDGSVAGKIQFGSGWWFLDQKEAMEWQMNALSNCGLLPRFIGMLTDSRSFMSYPRHEYFRRTLCNLIGADMERGLLPGSYPLVGGMVRRICYQNASDFLGLGV